MSVRARWLKPESGDIVRAQVPQQTVTWRIAFEKKPLVTRPVSGSGVESSDERCLARVRKPPGLRFTTEVVLAPLLVGR